MRKPTALRFKPLAGSPRPAQTRQFSSDRARTDGDALELRCRRPTEATIVQKVAEMRSSQPAGSRRLAQTRRFSSDRAETVEDARLASPRHVPHRLPARSRAWKATALRSPMPAGSPQPAHSRRFLLPRAGIDGDTWQFRFSRLRLRQVCTLLRRRPLLPFAASC